MNIKLHAVIVLAILLQSFVPIQKTIEPPVAVATIHGTITAADGRPVPEGTIFILPTYKQNMYIGGVPSIAELRKSAIDTAFADQGNFTKQLDGAVPHYIYFTSHGKRATSIYLPALAQSSIQLKATLFDPGFVRDENIPSVTSDDETINLYIKAYTLSNLSDHTDVKAQMDSATHYRMKNGSAEGFVFDLGRYYNAMLGIYNATEERNLKNFVLLNLAFLCVGDKYPVAEKYLVEAVKSVSPADPLWLAQSNAFVRGVYFGLGTFKKNKALLLPLMEGLVDQCPVEEMKPLQLYSLLYYAHTDELAEAANYYARLINEYPEHPLAATAIKRFPREMKIEGGKKLPAFSLKDADHKDGLVTEQTAKGKIRLIDFWATWCGPCVGQLPHLDSIYARYKQKGLEIISVSLDAKIDDVNKFRAKKWRMPWINAFAGEGNKRMLDDFEIFGIPKLVLVDKDGMVITANQNLLSVQNLETTLRKYLP